MKNICGNLYIIFNVNVKLLKFSNVYQLDVEDSRLSNKSKEQYYSITKK